MGDSRLDRKSTCFQIADYMVRDTAEKSES